MALALPAAKAAAHPLIKRMPSSSWWRGKGAGGPWQVVVLPRAAVLALSAAVAAATAGLLSPRGTCRGRGCASAVSTAAAWVRRRAATAAGVGQAAAGMAGSAACHAAASGGACGGGGGPGSPNELLRSWRLERRARLAPAIARAWARTDGLPRGSDADFMFQNVGPLVGCPPCLWVYFVGSPARDEGGVNWNDTENAVRDVLRIFEKVCDATLSYTLLSCSAGFIREPSLSPAGHTEDSLDMQGAFDASRAFACYDIVVAVNEGTREWVAELAQGDPNAECRLCCLADFLDVCEEVVQLAQLNVFTGHIAFGGTRNNAHSPCTSLTASTEAALAEVRRLTDLPGDSSCSGDTTASDARVLCVAGLERFLIAQFPQQMRDRLHPYLIPEGL